MRTLNRPMFNMGGPIKQGVMHGIREPKKNGGLSKQFNTGLVGDERYPKTDGRAHHLAFLAPLAWAARAAPLAWRGMKAARTFAPGSIGKLNRLKDIFGFSPARYRATAPTLTKGAQFFGKGKKGKAALRKLMKEDPNVWGKHQAITMAEGKPMGIWQALKDPKRFGMALRERPITAFGAATLPATGIDLAREHGADVGKGAWNLAKRFAAGVIPGDQSSWYTPPLEIDTVSGVPGGGDRGMYYDKTKKVEKQLSDAERAAFAKSERDARVQKYMDMMGYDRSKKTAIADALIDASKIVSDRGTLDKKNITAELINPIIQATSKRLDKPEQIREAVGLMMTKAGLEKEMYDAKPGTIMKNAQDLMKTGKYKMEEAIAIATKGSKGAVSDIQAAVASGKVGAGDWVSFVRATGAQHGEEVSVVTEETLKELYGEDAKNHPTAMEIITQRDKIEEVPDGIYIIGQETIRIKDGKKTQLK